MTTSASWIFRVGPDEDGIVPIPPRDAAPFAVVGAGVPLWREYGWALHPDPLVHSARWNWRERDIGAFANAFVSFGMRA